MKDVKEPTYKRKLNPPHIAYSLQDNEIIEDLKLIQKGMSNTASFTKYTSVTVTTRSMVAPTTSSPIASASPISASSSASSSSTSTTTTTTTTAMATTTTTTTTMTTPTPNNNQSDVYTDKGKLYYHNEIFDKGKDVFVESKQESGKWQGTLVVVNPAEIHIKSADGTKSRFPLSQLRNGKYSLTAVN